MKKIAEKNKNIYIKTTQRFSNIDQEINQFRPSESIQKLIKEQVSKYNNCTIGVHIRRTDNYISISKSPISLFVNKMNEELKLNEDVKFYLATDDEEVEEELINKFGSAIIVREKVLNRNKTEGIIDALIDMYCLSKTRYIYGSYWSSFSEVASAVSNIELRVLSKD